jgi:ferritin-like metal-binding protein YciE
MDRQIDHLADYPQLEERLREHRAETEDRIKRLDEILDGLDESASGLKATALGRTGNVTALGHMIAPDEILKSSFANFAFENYQAASYKSLIAIAEVGDFANAVPLLGQTLDEELAMTRFCDKHVAAITKKYQRLRAEGETVSH